MDLTEERAFLFLGHVHPKRIIIIGGDHLPFYRLELTSDDLVVFRPRQQRMAVAVDIVLPEWAEEKARQIAREKGWDYHALRANWMDFAHEATGKGNPPQNAGAAFVAYCKKQDALRWTLSMQ